MDFHPYDIHLKELKDFSDLVSQASDVCFHSMSFNELWDSWSLVPDQDVQSHVNDLRDRYLVEIYSHHKEGETK